ncbi:MAG: type II secretory pathway component [Glaciecola sp.]
MYLNQVICFLQTRQKRPANIKEGLLTLDTAQSGNMTVIALFVIVVVGLLSASLIKIVSSASNTTVSQVYGLRAQQAAQAGIHNLLQASFPAGAAAQACNQSVNSPASFSNVNGLQACSYLAQCSTNAIQFAGVDYLHYKLSSTGTCTVGEAVISRTLSVDATEAVVP